MCVHTTAGPGWSSSRRSLCVLGAFCELLETLLWCTQKQIHCPWALTKESYEQKVQACVRSWHVDLQMVQLWLYLSTKQSKAQTGALASSHPRCLILSKFLVRVGCRPAPCSWEGCMSFPLVGEQPPLCFIPPATIPYVLTHPWKCKQKHFDAAGWPLCYFRQSERRKCSEISEGHKYVQKCFRVNGTQAGPEIECVAWRHAQAIPAFDLHSSMV